MLEFRERLNDMKEILNLNQIVSGHGSAARAQIQ